MRRSACSSSSPAGLQSQGESGFTVRAGQTVQLRGTLTPLAQAPEVGQGVTADEGRAQLDQQGAFVSADAVTLARPLPRSPPPRPIEENP